MNTVAEVKYGDVTGDGLLDIVYITADQQPDSPFLQNISVVVQYGLTFQSVRIPLKQSTGHHPTLFLGDFTGNGVKDILVVIDTGGSGGTKIAYVFSFWNGQFYQIFDFEAFNQRHPYKVEYQNRYKVKVMSEDPKKNYILDLKNKGSGYLAEIYTPDGLLKKPISGWVSPLSGVYPIDFERDGSYELSITQPIAGRYSADRLGYVENVLNWNGKEFRRERQSVNIAGKEVAN